jgi:adenosylcobinamide kinase/adenosylcobinamide-phosphate guanylyltransferase
MAARLTLILGGARSGKSRYAEALAVEARGSVLYVATAKALDAEMEARISAHQANRPDHWITVEAPSDVAATIEHHTETADFVLLDCITLMAMNAYPNGAETDEIAQATAEVLLMEEIEALLTLVAGSNASWMVVSNEVGLGLVPPYPLGRAYRDALGRANQKLAESADEVIFMVAGLPFWIKGRKNSS